MDNSLRVPGYKCYVDSGTGEQPHVQIAFLDVEPSVMGSVLGVLLRVPRENLARWDERERNYFRRLVARERFQSLAGRDVWVYTGRREARERLRSGLDKGAVLVQRAYLDQVEIGFRDLGMQLDGSAIPPTLPVRELQRVDLPRR